MHTYRIPILTKDVSHKTLETQKHILFLRKKIKNLMLSHYETSDVKQKEIQGGKLTVLKQTLAYLIAH